MLIEFAPLQGMTDATFRRIHCKEVGGISHYYTPFIRWLPNGIRNKDQHDTSMQSCGEVPTVPQVIAATRREFAYLCDFLSNQGHHRIDLNMGCPFPMQVHAHRGCGLMEHPDRIKEIIAEMKERPSIQFSIKMRIGNTNPQQAQLLLPMLNEAPLTHITIHPRIATQQYDGTPNMEAFEQFYNQCQIPIIYNGDILTIQQIEQLQASYPNLHGIMIGRGLVANPTLLMKDWTPQQRHQSFWKIHDELLAQAIQTLHDEGQVLNHLQAYWTYWKDHINKKRLKKITKTRLLKNYIELTTATRDDYPTDEG